MDTGVSIRWRKKKNKNWCLYIVKVKSFNKIWNHIIGNEISVLLHQQTRLNRGKYAHET